MKDEVRNVFAGLRELPESQRAALVMAEVHGLSQQEIGGVMGVRADQVKAYVYQARSKLDLRPARARRRLPEIREELASARGAALLRGRLRRHVRTCPECRRYAAGIARQRRQLGALLPIVPSLALKYRAIEEAMRPAPRTPSRSPAVRGRRRGGRNRRRARGRRDKLLACKVAVGVACLGAAQASGFPRSRLPAAP